MLRSQGSVSKLRLWTGITVLCLFALFFALPAAAQADFTLTANPFLPDAIAPGGTTASNINVVTNAGFSGSITFNCAVTAPVHLPPEDIPVCTISPTSITAAGGATATITTTTSTSTIGYTVTITGTDGSGTQSQDLQLTVLSVTPQFTITVQSAIAPSSVTAGSGAEGTISINPLDGYMTPSGGYITLYCSSMTPLVTIAPVCSFSYPQGQKGLVVTGNTRGELHPHYHHLRTGDHGNREFIHGIFMLCGCRYQSWDSSELAQLWAGKSTGERGEC